MLYAFPLPTVAFLAHLGGPSLDNSNYTCRGVQRAVFQPPVTPSQFGRNIGIGTLISSNCSLWSCLNVRDEVSHRYRTTRNIVVVCILLVACIARIQSPLNILMNQMSCYCRRFQILEQCHICKRSVCCLCHESATYSYTVFPCIYFYIAVCLCGIYGISQWTLHHQHKPEADVSQSISVPPGFSEHS
jgi:hypothetical protein